MENLNIVKEVKWWPVCAMLVFIQGTALWGQGFDYFCGPVEDSLIAMYNQYPSCYIEFDGKSVIADELCENLSEVETASFVTSKRRKKWDALGKMPKLKYLQIGEDVFWSDLWAAKESLLYLEVSSTVHCDKVFGLPSLLVFNNMTGITRRLPKPLRYCSNLKALHTSVKTFKRQDAKNIPISVNCIMIAVNRKVKGGIVPSSFFERPELRYMFFDWGKKKPLKIERIEPELLVGSKLNSLSIPIDLGDENNVNLLKQLPELKYLRVKSYSSENYDLLSELGHIEKIIIDQEESGLIIGKCPDNVSWRK